MHRGGERYESRLNTTLKLNTLKNGSYYSYVRCAILIVRVGGMPWPKTGTTHYLTHLGLLDRGPATKVLLVYWILPPRGQKSRITMGVSLYGL